MLGMLVTKIRLVALCGFIAIISFGIACNGDGEVDLSDDPVLKASEKTLPKEKFIYYGDTAHVPYGNKSKEIEPKSPVS